MFWFFALSISIVGLAAVALSPKPQDNPPPSNDQIKAPTAEEGREIPVLFGTRIIRSPNIVWYGDIRIVPIKKKGGKK